MSLNIEHYSKTSQQFAQKILKYYPQSTNQAQLKENQRPYMHMHDHRKERQIFERTTQQKIQAMQTFKKEGNNMFSDKKYQAASYYYNKIIVFGDYTFAETQQQHNKIDNVIQIANINLGICLVKLKQPSKALSYFKEGLKGSSSKQKGKAYYWLAKISTEMSEFNKSIQYIEKLKEQNNKENQQFIQQLQNQLKTKKIQNIKKNQKLFSNMFSN